MTSLIHALHIGTLATWLSVAGFGTVAIIAPHRSPPPPDRPEAAETQWISEDFTLGGESSPPAAAEEPSSDPTAAEPAEPLPAPPEMPDLAPPEPLPEIPDLPDPPPPAPSEFAKAPPAHRPAARTESAPRAPRPAAAKPAGSSAAAGQPGGKPGTQAGGGAGAGLSGAARLAAGSMPAPAYPAESRRLGQTGTLVVEFTIDTSGRVISAYVKSASPWPLLNQEAVRAVRRWKFPPGPVMTLQRPIVFQLR